MCGCHRHHTLFHRSCKLFLQTSPSFSVCQLPTESAFVHLLRVQIGTFLTWHDRLFRVAWSSATAGSSYILDSDRLFAYILEFECVAAIGTILYFTEVVSCFYKLHRAFRFVSSRRSRRLCIYCESRSEPSLPGMIGSLE